MFHIRSSVSSDPEKRKHPCTAKLHTVALWALKEHITAFLAKLHIFNNSKQ
jgi:hypothetical protein